MKHPLLIGALCLAPMAAMAETYQFEVDGGYASSEVNDVEGDLYTLRGSYYFGGVDDSKGPLAEATFLDRASDITVRLGTGETAHSDADIPTYGVSGRHVNKETGLILGAGYSVQRVEVDGSRNADRDDIRFEAGYYVGEQATVTLSFDILQIEYPEARDDDSKRFGIAYKQLVSLEGDSAFGFYGDIAMVRFEKDFEGDDEDTAQEVIIGGDYYFNNSLSVGAHYGEIFSAGDDNTQRYGIDAKYFVTPKVSVAASYETLDFESDDDDLDVIRFSVQGRF